MNFLIVTMSVNADVDIDILSKLIFEEFGMKNIIIPCVDQKESFKFYVIPDSCVEASSISAITEKQREDILNILKSIEVKK